MYEYSLLTHDVDNPNIKYNITSGILKEKIFITGKTTKHHCMASGFQLTTAAILATAMP
jgi:hypothetical protein